MADVTSRIDDLLAKLKEIGEAADEGVQKAKSKLEELGKAGKDAVEVLNS